MSLSYGSYFLSEEYAYLFSAIILLSISSACWISSRATRQYTQAYHSFPALGLTTLIGGGSFIALHLTQTRSGYTAAVLGILCLLLPLIWLCARLLNPPPQEPTLRIKPSSDPASTIQRQTTQNQPSRLDELDCLNIAGDEK